jgi:hypothetical protein
MQIGTRIRRSWQLLVDQLAGLGLEEGRFLERFQEWVRTSPGAVSKKAADRLVKLPGSRTMLERDQQTMPLTKGALKELQEALRNPELPKDPEAYADFVDRLCWRMAVFRRDDDCCSAKESCDGDLELWTDGAQLYELCTAFPAHCFDINGRQLASTPPKLRPASRLEILAGAPRMKKFLAM